MNVIGPLITHDREKRGWSQEQIAKALKVSQQAASGWEQGSVPRRARLLQLAALFGPDSKVAHYLRDTDGAGYEYARIQHTAAHRDQGGAPTDPALVGAMMSLMNATELAGRLLSEASAEMQNAMRKAGLI